MRASLKFGLAAGVLVLGHGCAGTAPGAKSPAMPPLATGAPQEFRVMLAPGNDPKAGRLIAIATPAANWNAPPGDTLGRPRFLSPGATSHIAAQETPSVTPADAVRFDADMLSFPTPFSRIAAGEYWVQVRLDIDHDAAYGTVLDPNTDFTSIPIKLTLPTASPVRVTLLPERQVWDPETPASLEAARTARAQAPAPSPADVEVDAHIKQIDFLSPMLSEFWGKPTRIKGIVLLPPDYDSNRDTYPTVYRTEGFGASLASLSPAARRHYALMKSGDTPPMIRVFLDHSSPWGTHEFADSVNTGPWGTALTEELIPWLESRYRMDKEASGRFTTGHSSGGWFAIWQQVRYPTVFGGTWARSPDPVDFRSFTGINIYGKDANAYTRPDGAPQYLVRDASGKEITSLKDYAQKENVLGDYGGQIDSFDWVFSPRGTDGRPQPLFDRVTGKVDPEVARYWRDNFDIGHIVRRDWGSLKSVLDGKIHLIMGTMDTFHLDEAAKILDLEMQVLGADADFYWMEGRTHGNIDRIGDDPNGLEKKIAWEMYAAARPTSKLKPKDFVAPTPATTPATAGQ